MTTTRKRIPAQLIADQLKAQAIPDADSALAVVEEIIATAEMSAPLVRNVIGAQKELVKALSSMAAAVAITEQRDRLPFEP